MSFGTRNHNNDSPIAEINMVPMIDIMLVLLIVFMITAPLMTNSVKLQLPQASSQLNSEHVKKVIISIDEVGKYYVDNKLVDKSTLMTTLGILGKQVELPEIQLYADQSTSYSYVAELLSLLSEQGLHKIAFVTQPTNK
ncbi:biopolymer transporter ExbD [uncultured Tolumonas sp.]|uniref:ExbD/TolR family protein n=1 Tax=uncultured Tolumonas sp. TaxID=263765 RepID=UPI002931E6C0|nr:biopolymer transporter ExbD [uncultured Tolumonas sp.]